MLLCRASFVFEKNTTLSVKMGQVAVDSAGPAGRHGQTVDGKKKMGRAVHYLPTPTLDKSSKGRLT